jgi:hypothetical protein
MTYYYNRAQTAVHELAVLAMEQQYWMYTLQMEVENPPVDTDVYAELLDIEDQINDKLTEVERMMERSALDGEDV